MKYERQFTLDFSRVHRWQDVHTVIRQDLEFPGYYGRNPDALWDCLSDMFYTTIIIRGIKSVPKNKDCQVMMDEVLEVFYDAEKRLSHRMEIIFID